MRLPDTLQAAIANECAPFSPEVLRAASMCLTAQYRENRFGFQDAAARAAYLAVRMPATYAAICAVLLECKRQIDFSPASFLDLGAGPGTGSWAAASLFPTLSSLTLIEENRPMVEIGQRLSSGSLSQLLRSALWRCQPLQETVPAADLALLSYVVAELPPAQTVDLLERLWTHTKVIIVIEPGTPAGFRRILQIRDWALAKGAHLIAPCPHAQACPMQPPDWCHFPARVERTRIHKFLKSGSLGYEDEKFSYVAFGKTNSSLPLGRIVGPPKKASGFVQFPLCTQGKIVSQTVSRSQEPYRAARDAAWGDPWM